MNESLPTPYPDLNGVLRELVDSIRALLDANFIGAYLQGSFAVGDFDQHSDVDWIVVMEEELSGEQVEALQVMHGRIYQSESRWAQHLEGSYFPKRIWQDPALRGEKLWYLDNGSRSLIQADHCNTLVVRWTVRERGVVLAGPPPRTLVAPVNIEALRAEIVETMTGWGREIFDQPARYDNRFYQGFIVLNYCRMLHDYFAGSLSSKRTGAEWAKANLDPSWADLIDRAWDGRPNPAISVRQPADPDDFAATLKFVEVVLSRIPASSAPG